VAATVANTSWVVVLLLLFQVYRAVLEFNRLSRHILALRAAVFHDPIEFSARTGLWWTGNVAT